MSNEFGGRNGDFERLAFSSENVSLEKLTRTSEELSSREDDRSAFFGMLKNQNLERRARSRRLASNHTTMEELFGAIA